MLIGLEMFRIYLEARCLLFFLHLRPILSRSRQIRSVLAPFLTNTYHLVEDPATDDLVPWGENGTSFVVWRLPDFAKDVLSNYFKHNNFSGFVRQLNTYQEFCI